MNWFTKRQLDIAHYDLVASTKAIDMGLKLFKMSYRSLSL